MGALDGQVAHRHRLVERHRRGDGPPPRRRGRRGRRQFVVLGRGRRARRRRAARCDLRAGERRRRGAVPGAASTRPSTRYGRLDILVNNAGTTPVIPHADLDAVTDEIFHRILDTNLLGTWYLTRAALPHLSQSSAGVVVNVTSIAGVRPTGSSIPTPSRRRRSTISPACSPRSRARCASTPSHRVWCRRRGRRTGAHCTSGRPAGTARPLRQRRRTSPRPSSASCSSQYMTGEIVLVDGGLSLVSQRPRHRRAARAVESRCGGGPRRPPAPRAVSGSPLPARAGRDAHPL